MRCITSTEIAEDPAVVLRLKTLYDKLDRETTAASVLLPWFPSISAIKRLWTTKAIYDIVNGAINARQQSGVLSDDTLQVLLDAADDKMVIVGVRFLMHVPLSYADHNTQKVHHGFPGRGRSIDGDHGSDSLF